MSEDGDSNYYNPRVPINGLSIGEFEKMLGVDLGELESKLSAEDIRYIEMTIFSPVIDKFVVVSAEKWGVRRGGHAGMYHFRCALKLDRIRS